ncbi:MAG: phosphate/phosphite/phosphonate ABC transporter substrate-binding protein [Gammaproteobacteria bacterium]|nr:phosphate/phosphite/phosphonate ABC transporter substrate-binding protein [Gammaproteobacteria bacterium]
MSGSRTYQKFWLPVFLLAIFILLQSTCRAEPARPYLTFGFLPVVSSERLIRRFSPLAEYLSQELGIEVRMETAPDFSSFVHRTHNEKRYDILFTAPHLFFLAQRDAGYTPVVRVNRPGMSAVIVVPKDSDITTLKDLKGRKLAISDPLALATVLARVELSELDILPENDLTLISTPSHDASLLSSLRGSSDASVVMLPVYRRSKADVVSQMRVIATTQSVPHIPISTASWVDKKLFLSIKQVFLNMQNTETGRNLLKHLNWPGFIKVDADEYKNLEWIVKEIY